MEWQPSLSSCSVFYTSSCKARFSNQPDCALYLNFMIIVNAVITPITQQKKGKQFWVNFLGGFHNCFFKKCFINPWPFSSLVATQISWQLLKPAWTFNAHARCPSMVFSDYGHTHLSTHAKLRTRYRCLHTFSVYLCGQVHSLLRFRQGEIDRVRSQLHIGYSRCEHICARIQAIVLGLQVCSKMRLTTPCRCLTTTKKKNKKNSSAASKMQNK